MTERMLGERVKKERNERRVYVTTKQGEGGWAPPLDQGPSS